MRKQQPTQPQKERKREKKQNIKREREMSV